MFDVENRDEQASALSANVWRSALMPHNRERVTWACASVQSHRLVFGGILPPKLCDGIDSHDKDADEKHPD